MPRSAMPGRGTPLPDAYAVGLHGGTATDFYYATRLACPAPPRVLVYGAGIAGMNHDLTPALAPEIAAFLGHE